MCGQRSWKKNTEIGKKDMNLKRMYLIKGEDYYSIN